MVKSGRTIGRFLRKIVTSPSWYAVQKTSQEIRNLPTRLIREAGLEEMKDQLPDTAQIAKEFNLKTIGQDLSADIESEAQSSPDNNSYQDSGRDSDQNTDQISDISAWTTSPDTLETSPKSQKSE